MDPVRINLLTYNIHKGFNFSNRKFVLHQIRELLTESNVDIAMLQEIYGEHTGLARKINNWPDVSQYEFLADTIWPHYAYGKNAIYNSGHHGNAILSKYPFIEWENLNVSYFKRASRSLLHGVIKIPETGQTVHIICLHLDQFKIIRNHQLKRLKHRIIELIPLDAPLIVAGDFNDWSDHASKYLFASAQLSEVHMVTHGYHAKTFPSRYPLFALDRIYYRNLTLESCKTLSHYPWTKLSDHTPLTAEFLLETK
jgi:endonuclease/exonuclease/phosphatase family metal-dependent hydrolase